MTLTIEELKYGAEVGDLGIDAVCAVCAEALANREAKPVLYASEETLAYAKEGKKSLVTWCEPMGDAVIPLYTAPPAPTVPDEIDSFADQVIGTKNKIIRLPAPLYVPHEGIKVYLDADALLSCIERQGIFVLLDSI